MANKVPTMHLNTVKLHVQYMALKTEILEDIIMWKNKKNCETQWQSKKKTIIR